MADVELMRINPGGLSGCRWAGCGRGQGVGGLRSCLGEPKKTEICDGVGVGTIPCNEL